MRSASEWFGPPRGGPGGYSVGIVPGMADADEGGDLDLCWYWLTAWRAIGPDGTLDINLWLGLSISWEYPLETWFSRLEVKISRRYPRPSLVVLREIGPQLARPRVEGMPIGSSH